MFELLDLVAQSRGRFVIFFRDRLLQVHEPLAGFVVGPVQFVSVADVAHTHPGAAVAACAATRPSRRISSS